MSSCAFTTLFGIYHLLIFVRQMGSANLNDRSQKVRTPRLATLSLLCVMLIRSLQGDGDSEIALVVEDEDHIPSYMDGHTYSAGRFAATLRRRLCRRV